ncbi:unnamed protein product [Gadus morhua 'NCC']
MSELKDLNTEISKELSPSTGTSSDPIAKVQIQEKDKSCEEEEEEEEEEVEEEQSVFCSAPSEPSTLPWPGDKLGRMLGAEDSGTMSAIDRVSEEETAWSQSSRQAEGNLKRRSKWRESMPEGERWRAYESEGQHGDKGSGSLADGEEEEEDDGSVNWMPEKAALVFTPRVNILNNQGEGEGAPAENTYRDDPMNEKEPRATSTVDVHQYSEWPEEEEEETIYCGSCCSEKLQLCLAMVAALVLFPLLVWGGYALLPFDAPVLKSTPLRLVYTLRCAFFATVPIILGVVVQGAARLRFGELKPLYEGTLESREVAAHGHYVNDSLSLYLFYFLQLAVMATYLNQDHLKLVPLLTIIFAIGRLIYWACLSLGSSVRALGFGFSFFPILVMLGVNLYYIFSSVGQGAVFDVEPPATEAAPMQRWWG